MPSLRDYVAETEQWADSPREGDDLDIEIAPDELIEGRVIQSDGEYIVLEISESAATALAQRGLLQERIGRYGAVGSSRGMGFTVAEGVMSEIDMDLRHIASSQDPGELIDALQGEMGAKTAEYLKNMMQEIEIDLERQGRGFTNDVYRNLDMLMDRIQELYADERDMQESADTVEEDYMSRMLELAGMKAMQETAPIQPNPNAARTDPLAAKAADLAPVGTEQDPSTATTVDEGAMKDVATELAEIADAEDYDRLYDLLTSTSPAGKMVQDMYADVARDFRLHPDDDSDMILDRLMDRIADDFGGQLDEAATQQKAARPAAKAAAKPPAKNAKSELIPPNEIVSPPDGATAPGPGEPPHTNAAIEYNRKLGLPEEAADDDRPMWQRAYDKVVATVKSASQSELDRRKADNRAAMIDAERAGGLHGTVNEAFDQAKADAYNRAVQSGHSPEQAEKIAGIRDEDQNYYEIDVDGKMKRLAVRAATAPGQVQEAEYQGRKVPLGKPMRGDVKKFKVYVKDPKTGNVKKVNFGHGGKSAKRAGEKTLSIKKSNPARRKSFRARHNCDNPGPRTSARYWSCRMW